MSRSRNSPRKVRVARASPSASGHVGDRAGSAAYPIRSSRRITSRSGPEISQAARPAGRPAVAARRRRRSVACGPRGRCGSRTPGSSRGRAPDRRPGAWEPARGRRRGDFPVATRSATIRAASVVLPVPGPPRTRSTADRSARTAWRGRCPTPAEGHRGSDQGHHGSDSTIWHRQPTSVGRLLRADAATARRGSRRRLRASTLSPSGWRPHAPTGHRSCNERPGHQVAPAPRPARRPAEGDRTGNRHDLPLPGSRTSMSARPPAVRRGPRGDPPRPVCRRARFRGPPDSGAVGSASDPHTPGSPDRRGP